MNKTKPRSDVLTVMIGAVRAMRKQRTRQSETRSLPARFLLRSWRKREGNQLPQTRLRSGGWKAEVDSLRR